MSISDAYVRVMCDVCSEEEECELPFTYGDIMHATGSYDHERPRLPRGWIEDDDMHLCGECAESRRQAAAPAGERDDG